MMASKLKYFVEVVGEAAFWIFSDLCPLSSVPIIEADSFLFDL